MYQLRLMFVMHLSYSLCLINSFYPLLRPALQIRFCHVVCASYPDKRTRPQDEPARGQRRQGGDEDGDEAD